jgi:hypothetical protein
MSNASQLESSGLSRYIAAVTTPERAITAATDRSIPPLAITKTEPRAKSANTEDDVRIFSIFENVRK